MEIRAGGQPFGPRPVFLFALPDFNELPGFLRFVAQPARHSAESAEIAQYSPSI
jgi:hypothetical protein